jgi:acetyl-CoA C-acetyltransferase
MGGLSDLSGSHLGTVAARAALASCNVSPKEVEEVYMGCVLQAGMG